MKKWLIAINIHEGCYFLVLCTQINLCHACMNHECHWSMDASIVHGSILYQMFIFITERNG